MDLFELDELEGEVRLEALATGAGILRNFACSRADPMLSALDAVLEQAPLRNMMTPGGSTMSVSMTNCGSLGWISDRRGYRYVGQDPVGQRPWPEMPGIFKELAAEAAALVGYPDFEPDSCLVNRYQPGARMALHQDRDERDLAAPIVSISLGLPAVFLFGGNTRSDKPLSVPVGHGDVIVWGGASRLFFHGVRPLRQGDHSLTGSCRFNLTLRKAG